MAETTEARMLQFLPWCTAESAVTLGRLRLVPLRLDEIDSVLSPKDADAVRRILRVFVGVACTPKPEGGENVVELFPVRDVLVGQWDGKGLLADLNDGEQEAARELVDVFAFACLSNREYFIGYPSYYCNRDYFAYYTHRFTRRGDSARFTARRLDGQENSIVLHPRITAPLHVNLGRKAEADVRMLQALLAARDSLGDKWEAWLDAIRSFLSANADSEAVSLHQEIVFACGAFQRLCRSSKDVVVATSFSELVSTSDAMVVRDVERLASKTGAHADMPLRKLWMLELQRVRHAPAHGAGRVEKCSPWLPREHLFLAGIAFPLLVKAKLASLGLYEPTRRDAKYFHAFERVATIENFFRPLEGGRFWWHRALSGPLR